MPYNTEIAFNQKKKELAKERSKPDEVGCKSTLCKEDLKLKAHNIVAAAIGEASDLIKYLPTEDKEEFHQDLKDLALEYHDHGILA